MSSSVIRDNHHFPNAACRILSKILGPRAAHRRLTAPLYMVKQLSLIKMRTNLFTGGLNQLVLATLSAAEA